MDDIKVSVSPVNELSVSVAAGPVGPVGPTGAKGEKGDPGVGIPAGGSAGQVLAKLDGTDYHAHWIDQVNDGTGTTITLTKSLSSGGDAFVAAGVFEPVMGAFSFFAEPCTIVSIRAFANTPGAAAATFNVALSSSDSTNDGWQYISAAGVTLPANKTYGDKVALNYPVPACSRIALHCTALADPQYAPSGYGVVIEYVRQ